MTKKRSAAPITDTEALLAPHRMASQVLLGSRKELVIVHGGREYRLRLTQNGKLILTA